MHLRVGVHDPVKRELAGSYAKMFHRAHFAQRGGPKGTTTRLSRWFRRLAHCINSRTVPPVVVALVLTALDAPDAPSTKPCVSHVQLTAPLSMMANHSEKDDSGSCGWSDLGLSDADSLDDACEHEETETGEGDLVAPWLETQEDYVEALPRVTLEQIGGVLSEAAGGTTPALLDLRQGQDAETLSMDATCSVSVPYDRFACSTDDDAISAGMLDAMPSDDDGIYESSADSVKVGNLETCSNTVGAMDECFMMKPLDLDGLQDIRGEDSIPGTEEDKLEAQVRLPCISPEELSEMRERLRHVNAGSCADLDEHETNVQVQLRHVNADKSGACIGEDESKAQVQLRHVDAEEHVRVQSESKFQAKLRARKQLVELQKISGRGMLF